MYIVVTQHSDTAESRFQLLVVPLGLTIGLWVVFEDEADLGFQSSAEGFSNL